MTLLIWLAPSAVLVFALVWRSLRRDARLEVEQAGRYFQKRCPHCSQPVEPHHPVGGCP